MKQLTQLFRGNLACLALLLFSCTGENPEIVLPERLDLFDRFATQTVGGGSVLPEETVTIKFFPGSVEFLATVKRGQVNHLKLDESQAELLGAFTVPEVFPAPGEVGLTSVAFHPDFEDNQFLFMCFTTGDNKWNRIIRLKWSKDYAAVVASIKTVIDIDRVFPDEPQHGLYDLCFGDDGMLYAAIGDATQPEFSQDKKSLLGKLIRIAPRLDEAGGYDVPADNPYFGDAQARPEIAAVGLRTPWRILAHEDKIYIAEVGENSFEEIELYTPERRNFGWPLCEGHCDDARFSNPVFTISHQDAFYQTEDPEPAISNRLSVSLGVVYPVSGHDPYNDLLDGRLLLNDVFQGFVRAAEVAPNGALIDDQHIFHYDFVTSMALGPDGFIYGSTIFDSHIFRIVLK